MKNLILILFILPISCMVNSNSEATQKQEAPEGFTEMTAIKSEACIYLLQDKSNVKFEVSDIKSKIPAITEGKKVYIQYRALRRMSVCNAQPIEITEVYKQ